MSRFDYDSRDREGMFEYTILFASPLSVRRRRPSSTLTAVGSSTSTKRTAGTNTLLPSRAPAIRTTTLPPF